jgi:hypothetical protein
MHILCGGAVFVSIFVIHVRKKAFEKRFGDILKAQEEQRRKRRETFRDASGRSFSIRRSLSLHLSPTRANETGGVTEKSAPDESRKLNGSTVDDFRSNPAKANGSSDETERSGAVDSHAVQQQAKGSTSAEPTKEATTEASRNEEAIIDDELTPAELTTVNTNQSGSDHITFVPGTAFNPTVNMAQTSKIKRRNSAFSFTGVGASPVTSSFRRPGVSELTDRRPSRPALSLALTDASTAPVHLGQFLRKEVIGRNSQFHGLTHEEREQLGGVEYRAIQLLAWVVPLYFILWQLLGCLGVGAWMAYNASDITEANGINPWYVLFFSNYTDSF